MMTMLSRRGLLAAGVLGFSALPLLAPRAGAEDLAQRLVTVELFTSQGCSSCPPADALLRSLAERTDLLALSWPVDYWDYLGWHDTMAKPVFTDRQRGYAKKLDPHQPYTPQIVIDGEVDVVGSDRTRVDAAITARLKQREDRVAIRAALDNDSVILDVGTGPTTEATLWLLRYRPRVEVAVESGENRGRDLVYTNVVESCSPLGMWKGAPAQFELARADLGALGDAHRLAVLLQAADYGPVLGAARIG